MVVGAKVGTVVFEMIGPGVEGMLVGTDGMPVGTTNGAGANVGGKAELMTGAGVGVPVEYAERDTLEVVLCTIQTKQATTSQLLPTHLMLNCQYWKPRSGPRCRMPPYERCQ